MPYVYKLFPQWFRDEVSKEDDMPEETLTLLFSHIDPMYELHASFLKDIEQRMATWLVHCPFFPGIFPLQNEVFIIPSTYVATEDLTSPEFRVGRFVEGDVFS